MLDIINYNKSYGHLKVLNNVNFTIAKGEVVAIIGPSGSGKSTLLKTINYLVTPDSGTMHFRHKSYTPNNITTHDKTDIRRNMGMVFQNFGLFTHLTVLENITIVLTKIKKCSIKEAHKTALNLLSLVGLSGKVTSYPNQLSGGQQQRVGIARAMASNPDILLFDEPTSALDPELVNEVLKVVKTLADSGNTMIIVTHEMSFAKDIADRIIFMDKGHIIMNDTPNKVFSNNSPKRVLQFLERFNKTVNL